MKRLLSDRPFSILGTAAGALFLASIAGCAAEPVDSESEAAVDPTQDIGPIVGSGDVPQPPPAQTCVTIQRGGSGNVTDAFLAGDYSGYPTGGEINMYSGASSGGNQNRVVVGFDLSPLPAANNATIQSATFSIYKSWSADNATVNVYRATSAWNEATVTRESFGAAIDPVAVGSFSGGGTGMKSVDITSLVNGWRSGQYANDGIVLDEAPTAAHHYFSSEAGAAYAPTLEVCYVAATCADGLKNQNETGVDCGGVCAACPTCNDGVQNQGETGVDCGGPCAACFSCNDGIKNGNETGVDCGGSCPACPTCTDNLKNGAEEGIDCGGSCPLPCNSSQIGSFNINSGPAYAGNPQTYTCTEACAAIFGGTAQQYGCSTVNGTLNHLAWEDGWGDTSHCPGGTPVADTYEKPAGGNYNCGSVGCSYSAYVSDHGCTGPNYCWKTIQAPTSCKALLAAAPGTPSGVYTIDPDGAAGPVAAYQAYCDMTTDGGGWTLALRVASSNSVFKDFYSAYWTDNTLLNNTTNINPSTNTDAKFGAYTSVTGTEIRGCLRNPSTGVFGCKYYTYSATAKTLRSLFNDTPVGSKNTGKGLWFNDANPTQWLTMWGETTAHASTGACYLAVGLNADDDVSCYHARVRFGFLLNNECDINTLNDTAGFGASAYGASVCDGQESAWRTGAGFQAGATTYGTIGAMYVR